LAQAGQRRPTSRQRGLEAAILLWRVWSASRGGRGGGSNWEALTATLGPKAQA